MMRKWLDECDSNHEYCQRTRGKQPPVSFRLLDVRPENGNELVLVTGSECYASADHFGRYLTLSHCWGHVQETVAWKLIKSNLQKFNERIPLEILPRTFVNAVDITRRLGERYLWIDSLCILQDDAEDWATTAKEMDTIYMESYVTLISSSSSTEAGLYLKRNHLEIQPARLDVLGSSGAKKQVTIWPRPQSHIELARSSPSSKRAWCLQERELSRRIIQFTKQDILYECPTSESSESLVRRRGFMTFSDHFEKTSSSNGTCFAMSVGLYRDDTPQEKPGLEETTDTYCNWYLLVEAYNARQLTYESDKLVALSGLSRRFSKRLRNDSTFLAGLWYQDLLPGLLWQCVYPGIRSNEFVAPSWSWACLTANIRFDFKWSSHYRHLPPEDQLCVEKGFSNTNNFGIISSEGESPGGSLLEHDSTSVLLNGRIKRATCKPTTDEEKESSILGLGGDDLGTAHLLCQTRLKLIDPESKEEVGDVVFDTLNDAQQYAPSVCCLPVYEIWDHCAVGLALVPEGQLHAAASAREHEEWISKSNESSHKTPIYFRVGYVEYVRLDWFDGCERCTIELY